MNGRLLLVSFTGTISRIGLALLVQTVFKRLASRFSEAAGKRFEEPFFCRGRRTEGQHSCFNRISTALSCMAHTAQVFAWSPASHHDGRSTRHGTGTGYRVYTYMCM